MLQKFLKNFSSMHTASGSKGATEIKWKEHELSFHPHGYDGFTSLLMWVSIAINC